MKSLFCAAIFCVLLTGCGKNDSAEQKINFTQITAKEAKEMMAETENYILLDVRTQEEYDEGHIEGAYLIPDSEIQLRSEDEITDKDTVIFVYCRSGRRSKLAAQSLTDLGYTNVYEFGGIMDWPYETTK